VTVTAQSLAALHAEAFETPWSARDLAEVLAQDGVLHLGDDKAFLLLRVVADESEILTLAVRPSARRQGLGARLVTAAIGRARDMGAKFVFLEVAADNAAAIALYEKAGFERAGVRRGYYARKGAPAADGLLLRCDLNSPPA
jgi:ribosomal-protein-alanine N-acetyltransferase